MITVIEVIEYLVRKQLLTVDPFDVVLREDVNRMTKSRRRLSNWNYLDEVGRVGPTKSVRGHCRLPFSDATRATKSTAPVALCGA
jgi:hypothetical protein